MNITHKVICDGKSGIACRSEDAKTWKTKKAADKLVANFPTLPMEVVPFIVTRQQVEK